MFEKLNGKNIRNPIEYNDYVLLYAAFDLMTLQQEKSQLQQEKSQLQQEKSQLQEEKNLLLRQPTFSGNIKIL